jgi:hypothetical protein
MKKNQIKKISLGLVIACICLLGSGCNDNDQRRYTATNAIGEKFENLEIVRSGLGWVVFKNENGKELTMCGSYTHEEQ